MRPRILAVYLVCDDRRLFTNFRGRPRQSGVAACAGEQLLQGLKPVFRRRCEDPSLPQDKLKSPLPKDQSETLSGCSRSLLRLLRHG